MKKSSVFYQVIDALLTDEGGYVDHPLDPGGATNYGITRRTLAAHRNCRHFRALPKEEVMKLTRDEARVIYKCNYWDAIRLDEIGGGIAYALFDFGVNSGQRRAIKSVQRLLKLKVDGQAGSKTIAAINAADQYALVSQLCDYRMKFLQRLKHWKTFGRGWKARVDRVRSLALKLCAQPDAQAHTPKQAAPVTVVRREPARKPAPTLQVAPMQRQQAAQPKPKAKPPRKPKTAHKSPVKPTARTATPKVRSVAAAVKAASRPVPVPPRQSARPAAESSDDFLSQADLDLLKQ